MLTIKPCNLYSTSETLHHSDTIKLTSFPYCSVIVTWSIELRQKQQNGHGGVEVGFEPNPIPSYYDTVLCNKSRILCSTVKTRCSENDNTPQPLDQWTNSPSIGQQVGNCKSFILTHYLADLFAMHRGPRSIPLCIQQHIELTSLSFYVSRPSHS